MKFNRTQVLEMNKMNWTEKIECFLSEYERIKTDNKNKENFSSILLTEQCGSVIENSYTNFLMRLQCCMDWFDENIPVEGDIPAKNSLLYDFYMNIDKEYLKNNPHASMEGINMLKNVINDKNDELMNTFLSTTKDFFTSGTKPLMQKYHLNHHFTYYYISIRDKVWPKGIDFGWYPLGMNKLSNSDRLTFYFKAQGKEVLHNSELETLFKDLGYIYHVKSKSYRREIRIPVSERGKSFLDLTPPKQEYFLKEVYKTFVCPLLQYF